MSGSDIIPERMDTLGRGMLFVVAAFLAVCFTWGCDEQAWTGTGKKKLVTEVDLGPTIGSLADVFFVEPIPVGGYGLVGNLNGTGSAQCPPQIRIYLTRYILSQISGDRIDIEKFINSPDTAVVWIDGMIPSAASQNQHFDVKVTAPDGTQTTSLQDGWLYGAELMPTGRFSLTAGALASAQGPVFIDTIDTTKIDKKTGYILAGGTVLDEYKVSVALHGNDYLMTSRIRNWLNECFSDAHAKAVSPSRIELSVPAEYNERRKTFVSIIKAAYLDQTPEIREQRIRTFVRKLAVSDDKQASEMALEAIGNESVTKLGTLLNSSNEEVRLRAARCMLNIGSDKGLDALMEITMRSDSAYRIEALEAIATSAKREFAISVLRVLLNDSDSNIRLAAYGQLRKLNDATITQRCISRSFYLEQVTQTEHKAIFVSRSGEPRIVVFGAPIYCQDNVFVQSPKGDIAINAPAGQKYASIMRKHPTEPVIIGPMRSSLAVGDIIQVLCEEPLQGTEQGLGGLGVSYAEGIALLKQMCDKGAIRAEFIAGPPPKID